MRRDNEDYFEAPKQIIDLEPVRDLTNSALSWETCACDAVCCLHTTSLTQESLFPVSETCWKTKVSALLAQILTLDFVARILHCMQLFPDACWTLFIRFSIFGVLSSALLAICHPSNSFVSTSMMLKFQRKLLSNVDLTTPIGLGMPGPIRPFVLLLCPFGWRNFLLFFSETVRHLLLFSWSLLASPWARLKIRVATFHRDIVVVARSLVMRRQPCRSRPNICNKLHSILLPIEISVCSSFCHLSRTEE